MWTGGREDDVHPHLCAMNGWTAIVPIKPCSMRKTRLAGALDVADRTALTQWMLCKVLDVLAATPGVARVQVLAVEPPPGWSGGWTIDRGRGLNLELDAACAAAAGPVMVVFPDLPGLCTGDVTALADAAKGRGIAIAPDRHGRGTNALALASMHGPRGDFRMGFGPQSLARHSGRAGMRGTLVNRPGLALDIDTPADLAAASAAGWLHGAPEQGLVNPAPTGFHLVAASQTL